MSHALTAHAIRYEGLMLGLGDAAAREVAARLMEKLPPLWDLSYREMTGRTGEIRQIREESVSYRIDPAAGTTGGGDGRVVVAFGQSNPVGPLDADLFPRRPELAGGFRESWSSRGASFRSMALWCVENPGTFYFARPIYLSPAAAPHALEIGVLRATRELWVERFASNFEF